ncbi:MAG: hypothetical protein ACTSRE_17130 [Promethearchaeota archaeon]
MDECIVVENFRIFQLEDSGARTELDVGLDSIEKLLKSERVYLMVRFDLRRIFIWKGPRAPVRKKFISSQEANTLQKEAASTRGVRLKIISVDAGDEPIEFLMAFKIDSYKVAENEKLEDMYYIRNEERRRMEEAKKVEELKKNKKKGEDEYYSPIFEEEKHIIKMQKAKQKALSSTLSSKKPINTAQNSKETEILEEILNNEIPDGLKRSNIIVGTSLYDLKQGISEPSGKKIEENRWNKISRIHDRNIELDSSLIRIYCRKNSIAGIEILKNIREK